MDITILKQCIRLCRAAKITSFVWGKHGLGKSESHLQVANEDNMGFLDLRCSQLEASDLRGMPNPQDGMTCFLPPSDLPRAHKPEEVCPSCYVASEIVGDKGYIKPENVKQRNYCRGILFLDEVNRAEDDVLQALFQLVLDRKIGDYKLPDGWSVHCAGNFAKGDYTVNNFKDAALLDRFCHLTVSIGSKYMESWMSWMTENYPDADRIMQFISSNEEHLAGKVEGDLGFTIQPSPRSWAMVARVERVCTGNDFNEEVKRTVISGIVGQALALTYERFSCEIAPKDIMCDGIKPHMIKLASFRRNAVIGLTHGIAAKCKNMQNEKTEPMMHNVCDYIKWLCSNSEHKDMAVALSRMLVNQETSAGGMAVLSNKKIAKIAAGYASKLKDNKDNLWIKLFSKDSDLIDLMQKVNGY